jgi:hypothetical protein
MSEFIWNEDKQTYFQKDNINGWCVRKDKTALGKKTNYEISDGMEKKCKLRIFYLSMKR